jgi:hypothetical protein
MKRTIVFSLLALSLIATAAAQEKPVVLKDAPGRATVENLCSGCHSLDYVRINAPFMNKMGWTAEVNKMIQAFGAPIQPNDAGMIIDYLSANYGTCG